MSAVDKLAAYPANQLRVLLLSDLTGTAIARSGARDRLRAATHDVHMRLHAQTSFAQLAEGTIDGVSYKSLLALLYGFHAPLELALVQASNSLGFDVEMDRRRRVHLLHDDLKALRMTEAQITALPCIIGLPPLKTRGKLMGALYVREGSTLGGRVLARRLDGLLGSNSLHGRLFLAGDRGEPQLWQRCCSLVEEVAATGNLDDIIQAAIDTFAALETWLERDQSR